MRAAATGWLFLLVAAPQLSQPSQQSGSPDLRFRTSTDVVLLDVSVVDAGGKPVFGLDAEDFEVLEDGVPQNVISFRSFSELEPTPASALLLIDTSSSMEGASLREAREAALAFVQESPASTEIALAAFDDRLHIICDFTEDRTALAAAVDLLEPSGGTALYDALLEAARFVERARHPRRALVLLTDGADLDSRARFEDVERSSREGLPSVYAVGQYRGTSREIYMTGLKYFKPPALEANLNPVWVLKRLAELTGGRAFFPREEEPPEPLFVEMARALKHQYQIGYRLEEKAGEALPRFRRVEVVLRSRPQRHDYTIATRDGYVR